MNKKVASIDLLKQVIKVIEPLANFPNRDINFQLSCQIDSGLNREQSWIEHVMPPARSLHFEIVFLIFLVEFESAFDMIEQGQISTADYSFAAFWSKIIAIKIKTKKNLRSLLFQSVGVVTNMFDNLQ